MIYLLLPFLQIILKFFQNLYFSGHLHQSFAFSFCCLKLCTFVSPAQLLSPLPGRSILSFSTLLCDRSALHSSPLREHFDTLFTCLLFHLLYRSSNRKTLFPQSFPNFPETVFFSKCPLQTVKTSAILGNIRFYPFQKHNILLYYF